MSKKSIFYKFNGRSIFLIIIAIVTLAVPAQAQGGTLPAPAGPQPEAWWKANGDAIDATGNGYNGTMMNGATFAPGILGQAFSLDGVDDYVDLNTQTLGSGWNQMTVEAWINPAQLPTGNFKTMVIIGADDSASFFEGSLFNLFITNYTSRVYVPTMIGLNIVFGVRANVQPDKHAAIALSDAWYYGAYMYGEAISTNYPGLANGQWLHIVGVYDGASTKLYLNGQLEATSDLQPDGANRSVSGPLNTSSIARRIGASSYAPYLYGGFKGLIDDVRIYNRTLPPSEIQANYNNGIHQNNPPVANAGVDQILECTGGSSAAATLNGSASSDPDGDPLTYSWAGSFGAATGVTTVQSFALGLNTATLTVDDGNGLTATDTVNITVQDTLAPTVNAGADVTVEAAGPAGANFDISGQATYSDSCNGVLQVSISPVGVYAIGSTTVTVTATDGSGNSASDTVVVNVVDTTPPAVTATLVPLELEDDEGKFRVEFSATDTVDPNPAVSATLNGTTVTNGQVVELERKKKAKVKFDDGELEISGLSFALAVTATDQSNNSGSTGASFAFPDRDDDDKDKDKDKDKDDDDKEKKKKKEKKDRD